jgi:hypothetical protein
MTTAARSAVNSVECWVYATAAARACSRAVLTDTSMVATRAAWKAPTVAARMVGRIAECCQTHSVDGSARSNVDPKEPSTAGTKTESTVSLTVVVGFPLGWTDGLADYCNEGLSFGCELGGLAVDCVEGRNTQEPRKAVQSCADGDRRLFGEIEDCPLGTLDS